MIRHWVWMAALAGALVAGTAGCPAGWNEQTDDDDDDDDDDITVDDDDDDDDDTTPTDDDDDDTTPTDDDDDDTTSTDDDDDDTTPTETDDDNDGWSVEDGDCNDNNPNVNPGQTEVPCDGLNNDCDGSTLDEPDADNDGYSVCEDCDDANNTIYPGAAENPNNGVDDDCDGDVDEVALPCNNPETEPNDSWLQPDALSASDEICGMMDIGGDQDWFAVAATAWTQVDFDVIAQSDGSQMTPVIQLYSDDGTTLLMEDSGTDPAVSGIFPSNGTFYVSISDSNPAMAGAHAYYTLETSSSSPCDTIEVESNDDYTLADPAVAWGVHCGESTGCDPIFSCDLDYYYFYVFANETWTFDIDALDVGSWLVTELRLFDTDGTTELASDEDDLWPGDPLLTYTFPTAGTYYIEVSSDWYVVNDIGPYMLYIY